jgi:hypothetical protein
MNLFYEENFKPLMSKEDWPSAMDNIMQIFIIPDNAKYFRTCEQESCIVTTFFDENRKRIGDEHTT